jgi:hypothetical protein
VIALAVLVACHGGSDTDLVTVDDLPPQADAGVDRAQPADLPVELDGRSSFDPEGNTLVYHWTFDTVPDGSAIRDREAPFTNDRDTSGVTVFRPDQVGVYVVELVVWDGRFESEPDYVVVDATSPQGLPIADAGADQVVDVGAAVSIDGSASFDPRGGALAYAWTLVGVPERSALTSASLTGADAAVASFTPDAPGDYIATLVVTGDLAASNPDSVVVHASGGDNPPIADAGADTSGPMCTPIALDCGASVDPDGLALDYSWDIQARPPDSTVGLEAFTDPLAAQTGFFADDVGDFTLSCSVFDGTDWSIPDLVDVTVTARTSNEYPDIDSGADRFVAAGTAHCRLQGSRYVCDDCPAIQVELGADGYAFDVDGDPLEIAWTQTSGGAAQILDATVVSTQVVLPPTTPREPASCTETEFKFRLTVTDCPGATSTDNVTLTAECCGSN